MDWAEGGGSLSQCQLWELFEVVPRLYPLFLPLIQLIHWHTSLHKFFPSHTPLSFPSPPHINIGRGQVAFWVGVGSNHSHPAMALPVMDQSGFSDYSLAMRNTPVLVAGRPPSSDYIAIVPEDVIYAHKMLRHGYSDKHIKHTHTSRQNIGHWFVAWHRTQTLNKASSVHPTPPIRPADWVETYNLSISQSLSSLSSPLSLSSLSLSLSPPSLSLSPHPPLIIDSFCSQNTILFIPQMEGDSLNTLLLTEGGDIGDNSS